jgi:hypothetical protein
MSLSKNPKYLRLKREYREKFLAESIRLFPGKHYSGLAEAIRIASGISISKATLTRIFKGDRPSDYEYVKAVCEYYEYLIESGQWFDACEDYENTNSELTIDDVISQIKRKIRFPFEPLDHHSKVDQGRWVQQNFVEPYVVEVSYLPSEYPALDRERLICYSQKKDEEDEFDRREIQLLRGKRVAASDAFKQHQKLFIYGDPGSGKSSCLQNLAFSCRDGSNENYLTSYLPIFVDVKRYFPYGNPEEAIKLADRFFESWDIDRPIYKEILDSGRVLFLFDGLDEVPEHEHLDVRDELEEILRTYESCRFVLTSRLASIFPFVGIQKAIIAPFYSREQIPEFINRWFEFHGESSEMAETMLEKLRSGEHASMRELARRPILLDLLCRTYRLNKDFPTRRVGVFSDGIDELTREGYQNPMPGQNKIFLEPQNIKGILRAIAINFFLPRDSPEQNNKAQILFMVPEVEDIILSYCEEVCEINPARVNAKGVIQHIEQVNGLLVRWGESYCSFSHLRYQEYFAAEYLSKKTRYKNIYPHLFEPRWKFVVELVSELVSTTQSWDFFQGFKSALDNYIIKETKNSQLVEFLSRVSSASTEISNKRNNERPHFPILLRAWYFSSAFEDSGEWNNIVNDPNRFELPDFYMASSMVSGRDLQVHRCMYKAYHCCDELDKASNFEAYLHQMYAISREDCDSTVERVVEGWINLVQQQKYKLGSNDWWAASRSRWKKKVATFLDTLELPSVHDLKSEQRQCLRAYYYATKLLSTCLNRSPHLSPSRKAELADAMLKIAHLG